MGVVRLKIQWNWATPGRFTWKIEREQSCKSELFKVTNTAKNFSKVFISLRLTKNDVKSLLIKITSKKVSKNNVHISTIEITLIKVRETTWIFRPSKSHRKSTRKWRRNSSKFGLWRIDVISTSNRRGFDVVCPLGSSYKQRDALGTRLPTAYSTSIAFPLWKRVLLKVKHRPIEADGSRQAHINTLKLT